MPESPGWLAKKKRITEATAILQKVGGSDHAEMELESIQKSFMNEIKESVKDLFKFDVKHIVFIGVMVAVFSQADG